MCILISLLIHTITTVMYQNQSCNHNRNKIRVRNLS